MSTSHSPSRGRVAVALTAAAAATAPAAPAVAQPTPVRGPVIISYAPRTEPRSSAPLEFGHDSAAPFDAQAVVDVTEVELVKLTRGGGGAKLAVSASEPGKLQVTWTAGGSRGSEQFDLRAGHHDVRLSTPKGATHVRVQATLVPSSGALSATTHGAFRLR